MLDKPDELDLVGIFDDNAEWEFASTEVCQRGKFFPNMLAFSETRATLCLIAKRSSGGDYALSVTGLEYLCATLDKGVRKDGSEVRQAFVVLAEFDRQARSKQLPLDGARNPRPTK